MRTIFIFLVLFPFACLSQNLKRQASWPFRFTLIDEGLVLAQSVDPQSIAAKAGLREGDQIISINNQKLSDLNSIEKAKSEIKAGATVTLMVVRSGEKRTISFKAPMKPYETIEGIEVKHGEVKTSFGYYVQTITTLPVKRPEKLPALFFVGWLSCDPVETNPSNMDGWAQLIQDFAAKSGMAFMRVEKPGLGDSQGPDCSQCDLSHELAAYASAFKAFKRMSFVDSTQMFVFGGSIGGALAPVLMQNEKLKGMIVANTFSRTWFEHFMDFERTRLELSGSPFSTVNKSMTLFAEFYTNYLIHQNTPGEIVTKEPHLKEIWYDEPSSQFGRPSAYHQQVQQLDVSGAWEKINFPVLVLYGEYDWIMSRYEHDYIVHVVNETHPGNATLQVIPQMDHHFSVYKSPQEAFESSYINYSKEALPIVMNWIKSR